MLCSHCQESLAGLVNKLNSKPTQWAWVMADSWFPKPSPKDTLNQGVQVALVPFHLHQCQFNFCNQDLSPWSANLPATVKQWEVPQLVPETGKQEWDLALQKGWDWGQRQQELWVAPPQTPSLLSDHGFDSDRSTASISSSVLSMSERLGRLRHPCCGWHPCWEPGGHVKINLLVFKDKDTKDAVTYHSWHWDLTVYHHAGCQDTPFSPMPSVHYKVTRGSLWEVQGWISPLIMSSPY